MRLSIPSIAGHVSAKILVATLASVVTVMSASELIVYRAERAEEVARLWNQAEVAADRLAFTLDHPVAVRDDADTRMTLAYEMKDRDVLAILVEDAAGGRIAGSVLHDACRVAPFDPASADPALLRSAAAQASRPIVKDGRRVGNVRVYLSDTGLRERLRLLVAEGVRHTAVLSLVFAAVLFLCIRTIVIRPLQLLEASAGTVAQGDFGAAIPVASRDEVGRLGESFNRMVERLRGLYGEVRASEERLRDLSGWQRETIEAERKRIARGIHDDLSQQLTALRLDLHWVERRLSPEQEAVAAKVRSLIASVDRTHDVVERIIRELRPQVLDDLGLVAAIEWLAADFEGRTGIAVEVDAGTESAAPSPGQATALFRIAQEALTNVARHADAALVEIRLRERCATIRLSVRDDGKGFDPSKARRADAHGLLGIEERARLAGGRARIRSGAGRGTEVAVLVPNIERGGPA